MRLISNKEHSSILLEGEGCSSVNPFTVPRLVKERPVLDK